MKSSSIAAIGGGIAAAIAIGIVLTMSGVADSPEPSENFMGETTETNVPIQTEKIKVLATFYPYYEFARNVAGDSATVEQYLPAGVEAHDWEPRPQEIQALKSADVLVYNGLGMEPYLDRMIDSEEFDSVMFLKASEGVELVKPEEEHDDHGDEGHDDHAEEFAEELEHVIEEFEHNHIDASHALTEIDEILHEHEGDGHDHGNETIERIESVIHEIEDGHMSAEEGLEEIHHIVLEIKEEEHDDHGDEEHDDHEGEGHGTHGFEWAGVFDVAAGTYYWSFAKVGGDYADPAMKMIILESNDIESSEELAETLLESDNVESKNDGNALVAKEVAYLLNFDESKEMTIFSVNIDKDGKYAFFTEHMPFEFEANEHFFKDASKNDVEPIMQEPEAGHGHHHHHHDFEFDPHIWLDPVLVKQQVNNIRDGLIEADPQNKEHYEQNAIAYNEKLDALDMKIKSSLTSCKKDTFVPYHNAFTYLAERYDIKVMALGGLAPRAEATAADLAEFIDFVKDNDIKVIFQEELVDPRLAEVVAKESGAELMLFSPLEAVIPGEAEKTYIEKMEENLNSLKIALECQ